MGDYRSLDYTKRKRPPFEQMISDLGRAKKMWDIPVHRSFNADGHMKDYSISLLKLVGAMATDESAED